ncbi:MAG TPA: zf-HC2 domain-containing protein [Candidatus Limnocylindrales bacterium]|nr:zf-HC2 domain-containing protein [Candidatus Limnocylindrales bacterium]
MTRASRLRRRTERWPDSHERARARLAERLDGPLELEESTWLDEHMTGCASCAAVAAAYAADRQALRGLRDQPPEPPRDLWARTAAAIEAEGGSSAQKRDASVRRSLPLGAFAGVMVVVVMVGVGLLTANLPLPSGGVKGEESPTVGIEGGASPVASIPTIANATPIAVDPEAVGYVSNDRPGTVYSLSVDEVCAAGDKADCAVREGTQLGTLFTEAPKTILASPTKHKAVAIANTAAGTDEVMVVDLPEATERPRPTRTPAASASAAPTPTPAAPTTTPAASASSKVSGSPEPTPSASAATPTPTASIASIEPSATPSATAGLIAIASGIEVVGESAAFSPDGTWFAFTARAADEPKGADVYAWRVGSAKAVRVTDDGASYFASWSDNDMIVSRPTDPSAAKSDPASVRVDPANGNERDAGDGWRPAVDPTGKRAIVWVGTLKVADDGSGWVPDKGRLELRSWSRDGAGRSQGSERDRVVTDSAPRDFDVRWDETGEWVAVWVADRDDTLVGRLTLFHVDSEKDRLERVDGAPVDVRALPGFSMGDGRLAWATPRGQGGEGSRIQIAAWSKTDVGIVESNPGEDPVVIR